ncbi:MAG: hypothetical protein GC149_01505 [Gammaproteobacteria bacterium]|nr:hypothetical protein [Gammaproteobacteria bacterium]
MANAQAATQVSSWDFETRLKEMLETAIPKLGPEVGQQLKQMVSPESLAIMAGVLVAWIISHGAGVGEIIDVVILTVGVFAIGMAIFSGLDYLFSAVSLTYHASSKRDLEKAADDFSKAISILGVQTVLAILFRKVPVTRRGGRFELGEPPRTPGIRYKPKTEGINSSELYAGEGSTNPWGDITISLKGSINDQKSALYHEKVHQFLAPKLYLLRNFRVQNLTASYFRSSLWRYVEEALAETVSQVGVYGIRKFFVGVKFPVKNGYVFLTRGGGFSVGMKGAGIIPEGASLISSGLIYGISFRLWFSSNPATKKK